MWARINFYVMVQLLLPTFLRKPKQTALLNGVLKPLDSLYVDVLYKMQHDSRVIYLEKVMNEYFEAAGYSNQNHAVTKVIYITDEIYPPENYVYQNQEFYPSIEYDEQVLYLDEDNIFLTDSLEHFDFVINIPIGYAFDEQILRLLVDFYKIAGKKYRIQIVPLSSPAPDNTNNNNN